MLPEITTQSVAAVRFVGGRAVTAAGVLDQARVRVEDGIIVDVDAAASGARDIDLGGALLLPGLVDLHTDNLERHYMPRPGAGWDPVGAAVAHDGQIATSGITTVFDSLSLHGSAGGLDRLAHLTPMLEGVTEARENNALRVDHRLHLRCEVSAPDMQDVLQPLLDRPDLGLLSVMDHTPGQGQYHDVEGMRVRMRGDGQTDAEIEQVIDRMYGTRDTRGAQQRRELVAAQAEARGIAFASHDDLTAADVDRAACLRCTIAEFPVSLIAARHARTLGLVNALGAPNFVRGGSHSGNLSARDAAQEDLLDVLCSDYVPMAMLRAVFQLTEAPFAWSLPKAVATATLAPARAVGLADRGEIAVGKRADLLVVDHTAGAWPRLREVWVAGMRAA